MCMCLLCYIIWLHMAERNWESGRCTNDNNNNKQRQAGKHSEQGRGLSQKSWDRPDWSKQGGATSAVWKWFGYEKSVDMSLPVGFVNLRLLASCLCSCLSFNRCKSGRHYVTILTNFYIRGKWDIVRSTCDQKVCAFIVNGNSSWDVTLNCQRQREGK